MRYIFKQPSASRSVPELNSENYWRWTKYNVLYFHASLNRLILYTLNTFPLAHPGRIAGKKVTTTLGSPPWILATCTVEGSEEC